MASKVLLLLFSFLVLTAQAQSFKKYAGEFLHAGVGSRALAMGGAQVAVAEDVTAGYWNPAGLNSADGMQLQFMHAQQFISSIQYDYLAISNRFDDETTLALSVIRFGVNDIKDTRSALLGETIADGLDLSKVTKFNTSDYAFIISYAKPYNDKLTYGANVKLIYRDYYSESAYGLGFDAGLRYQWNDNFIVGLMARDLTTTMMAWSTQEKEYVAPSLRPGVSYLFQVPALSLTLRPAMDLAIYFESREEAAQFNLGPVSFDTFWGGEIGYDNLAFLRFGYDDLNRINMGVGLQITRLGVDYSYTNFDQELGNVHRVSFRLRLGNLTQ
jgi:hypothetical protein